MYQKQTVTNFLLLFYPFLLYLPVIILGGRRDSDHNFFIRIMVFISLLLHMF